MAKNSTRQRVMDGTANHPESLMEDQSLIDYELELGRVFRTNLTMREVAQLKTPTIKTREEAIRNQQIAVIGAYYEISSGAVDFFETKEDLAIDDEILG